MLKTESFGADSALPALLIVHGLFGSGRNWGAIARRMADGRRVVTVDMRNHGGSFRSDAMGYADMAGDLAQVIRAQGGRMDVVGHSMGGKAAMVLALTEGALVNRLVVADIAPVAYAHSQSHLIDAMQGLDLTGIALRGDADRRLMTAVPDDATRAFLLQSLDLKSDPPEWRLNLPVLRAAMDRITGWPDVTGHYDGPTLFLSGSASHYVRADHRPAIKALFPNAKFAKLVGAGHWLHAERPREFEATLRAFLG
jgi:esterase